MKITKYGHSCVLVQQNGVRILIDPGQYSTLQNEVSRLDFVFITHEHPDHLDMGSVKQVLKNNPQATVYTNSSVHGLLVRENILAEIVKEGDSFEKSGVSVEIFGKFHAQIYHTIPCIDNIGIFIAGSFFYPGDALFVPPRHVDVLAWPANAPWMRLSEAIDYALEIQPKLCFPVHDGILKSPGISHRVPPQILEPKGISFRVFDIGKEVDV